MNNSDIVVKGPKNTGKYLLEIARRLPKTDNQDMFQDETMILESPRS